MAPTPHNPHNWRLNTSFLDSRWKNGSKRMKKISPIKWKINRGNLREVQSIASLFGAKLSVPEDYDPKSPYLVVDLPDEECAKNIAGRAILIKSLYELWGQASDYDGLFSKLNALPEHFTTQYLSDCSTFRFRHDSFNKVISFQQKLELIENVLNNSGLRFSGGIDLKSPDHSFHLLEYYGRQDVACAPETPEIIYFGRWITNGHRESIKTYNLKKRKFIGNTSMDAALAMIMANMGQVNSSKLVFDPFVGTGSLLVASAHYGAYVLGTEIDWKLLHGRGRSSRANQKWRSRDENIRNSLSQYDLGHLYIDALVADASKHALWWKPEIFDAIITDPPYGIREQTRKVGTMKESVTISDEVKEGHIPEKVSYELSQILCDLLNFAAKHLRLGGRLVYWLPVYKEDYVAENVPRHPCLDLVANSEQPLSARIARRLVTMHKTKHFHPDLQLAELLEDHYKDASFRDKYFRPSEKGPRDVKKPKVKGTSRGQRERSLPPSYNEPCVDDPSARDDSHDTGCMNKMCLSDGPCVASVSATNRDNELITEIENKSTLMPNNWEDKG